MIRSFRCRETEAVFEGRYTRRFAHIASVAEKRLAQIHAARSLLDLALFPGNRLEALKGDRRGQHSTRVNDRYRVCSQWKNGDAYDVEIVDYH